MEMGEGGDGPLSLLYFVESNIHLVYGSPQHTGFAAQLFWSPAVIDGTSRSLCLCM